MKLNPEQPNDLTNYNIISQAAAILALGDEDEWSYFLNQVRTRSGARGFVELMLKVRDDIKERIEGPVTPAEYFGDPPPFGDLPPTDKGDIPEAFKGLFDD